MEILKVSTKNKKSWMITVAQTTPAYDRYGRRGRRIYAPVLAGDNLLGFPLDNTWGVLGSANTKVPLIIFHGHKWDTLLKEPVPISDLPCYLGSSVTSDALNSLIKGEIPEWMTE